MPLLAELPGDRLGALHDASVPRRYATGEVLRSAGQPAGRLLLLLAGRVSATTVTPAGGVVRYGAWAAPCALDKVAVIDGRGHTATLTALSPCEVRSLPREAFLALVDDAAAVRAHVLRVLAGQARAGQARFADAAGLPAGARLAGWLLAAAARAPEGGRIALPGSQQALADELGVSRVTVNRALARLRRDGIVACRRGEVAVLAPELLALRAEAG